jgi:hypothetical protein
MCHSLSEATESTAAESPWIPPDSMPISSDSATNMLSAPVLSPKERHCTPLAAGRSAVGLRIVVCFLVLESQNLILVSDDV